MGLKIDKIKALYEIKAICTNLDCRHSEAIGYADNKDIVFLLEFPDSIYDGECPKCKSQINMRIFDLKKEKI